MKARHGRGKGGRRKESYGSVVKEKREMKQRKVVEGEHHKGGNAKWKTMLQCACWPDSFRRYCYVKILKKHKQTTEDTTEIEGRVKAGKCVRGAKGE